MTRVVTKSGVSISVNGRVYEADTPFNLRNVLLGARNDLHEAAREVEKHMEQRRDPMIAHVSRLGRLP